MVWAFFFAFNLTWPGVSRLAPGRTVVLRIDPLRGSTLSGFYPLTPSRLAALGAALALQGDGWRPPRRPLVSASQVRWIGLPCGCALVKHIAFFDDLYSNSLAMADMARNKRRG